MLAAADLGRGRAVATKGINREITYFLLAKEFNWLPDEIDRQDAKIMKALNHMLNDFNKVQSAESKKMSKRK